LLGERLSALIDPKGVAGCGCMAIIAGLGIPAAALLRILKTHLGVTQSGTLRVDLLVRRGPSRLGKSRVTTPCRLLAASRRPWAIRTANADFPAISGILGSLFHRAQETVHACAPTFSPRLRLDALTPRPDRHHPGRLYRPGRRATPDRGRGSDRSGGHA